ncbi:MAG: hypothetical protein OEY28_09730 [Nitrospira sp.]|nr:hypothetical protein [Nitrospira sp.]
MATKKISALTSLAQDSIDPAADVLPINDTGSSETKKATAAAIVGKSIGALAATWNNALTTFKARVFNVTDTNSAAGSLLDDLQVGGVSKWSVRKDGELTVGTVPFDRLSGNAFGQFESTVDQTAVANTATVVTFSASAAFNAGVTLTSSTQLVCAAAGIYEIVLALQFANSDSTNHTGSFWFRKNGTDIANSAFTVVVPKAADGGVTFAEATVLEQLTAGQYIECVFAVSNAAAILDYTAASGASPVRPAIPSAIATIKRIG